MNSRILTFVIIISIRMVLPCPVFSQGQTQTESASFWSPVETSTLTYLREYEWMAADVYNYFLALHPLPLFQNMGMNALNLSEMAHLLLLRNNIADPSRPHIPGKYTDTTLNNRYQKLVTHGKPSQDDALLACLSLEEFTLQKVMLLSLKVHHPDLVNLTEMVARSSRNHLRALFRHAATRNLVFEPTYLSPEFFTTVVNQPHERGRGPHEQPQP